MVPVRRGTWRIVRRQSVKSRGNSRRIEKLPERHTLAPEHRFAVDCLRRGVEGKALLLWMPVHEIKDAVRARPGTINEVSPGNRALRWDARPQWAEAAGRAKLRKIGKRALVHHALGQPWIH